MKENDNTLAKVEDKINNARHNLNEGEIVLYQPDENIALEVRINQNTVWLSQQQMSELFDTDRTNILRHIRNIYTSEELSETSTCAKIAYVRMEGSRSVVREIPYYNLDLIISVGFRVNSKSGIRFRQWATTVLREHLLKGYTINHHLVALQQNVDSRLESLENRVGVQEQQVAFLVNMHQQPLGASVKDMGKGLCTVIELGFSPEKVLGKVMMNEELV